MITLTTYNSPKQEIALQHESGDCIYVTRGQIPDLIHALTSTERMWMEQEDEQ